MQFSNGDEMILKSVERLLLAAIHIYMLGEIAEFIKQADAIVFGTRVALVFRR